MINVNNLKPGISFIHNNDIFLVMEAQHSKQGRGQATVKVKVKNLRSKVITTKTFIGGDKVTKAYIEKKPVNYLYNDGQNLNFMDNHDFEQIAIPMHLLLGYKNFLKEGLNLQIRMFNDEIIDLELPINIELEVTIATEAIKGNTQSNPQKKVRLETGLEIEVPMFIKQGEKIIVSSETGKYVGRSR